MLFNKILSHHFPHRIQEIRRLNRGGLNTLADVQLKALQGRILQEGESFWIAFAKVPDEEIRDFVTRLTKAPLPIQQPSSFQKLLFYLAVVSAFRVGRILKRVAMFFTF